MKKYIYALMLMFLANISFAQQNSKNGYEVSPKGQIRILVVFAEAVGDPIYNEPLGDWLPGQMPPNPDTLFNATLSLASVAPFGLNIGGGFTPQPVLPPLKGNTKYFHDASFGSFEVLGDYYPHLVQIPYNELSWYGGYNIHAYLNNLPTNQLKTKNGYTIPSDFDMRTVSSGKYYPKQNVPDGKVDLLYIFWRVNSVIHPGRGAGYMSGGANGTKVSSNYIGAQCSGNFHNLFVHEFAHQLLGHNDYHSGGAGAGPGNFLSDIGGYGILQSYLGNLHSPTAWDRRRLAWKHAQASYEINARSTSSVNVNGDLNYQQNLGSSWSPSKVGDFILRDFATYGDALRIKLPYLRSENSATKEQWLWIENHQLNSTKAESYISRPKGVRMNIQVGNEEFTDVSSRTNYYVPLSRFGNWDFTIMTDFSNSGYISAVGAGGINPRPIEEIFAHDSILLEKLKINKYIANTNSNLANPFNGYHLTQTQAGDFNNDNGINAKEFIAVETVKKDGQALPYWYPVFGNEYDVFPVGSKLSLGSNPSPVPLLTHQTTYRHSGESPLDPASNDNRTTYLNGLSVEIVEQYANGSVRVRVRWDDFAINNDVRWCGNIVSKETINLASSKTIKLAQGTTPIRSKNPITFAGRKVFASPSVLTCKSNSKTILNPNSKIQLTDNSALIIEGGAVFQMESGSTLIVERGSTLQIKKGAIFPKEFNINVQQGGYLCIEEGFNQPFLSHISISPGIIVGCNSNTIPASLSSSCGNIPIPTPQYANAPKNSPDTLPIYESVFGKFSTEYSMVGPLASIDCGVVCMNYTEEVFINSIVYKRFSSCGSEYQPPSCFLHESEDHSKVYLSTRKDDLSDSSADILVMDLSMQLGDTFSFVREFYASDTSLFRVDSIFFESEKKHILLKLIKGIPFINNEVLYDTIVDPHLEFIEGVGTNFGLFYPYNVYFISVAEGYLLCAHKDSVLSYQNKSNYACDHHLRTKFISIESVASPSQFLFTLIPNPAHSQVTLRIDTPFSSYKNVSIDILDIQGRPLHHQALHADTTPLELSKFKAGIYIVKLNIPNAPTISRTLIIN